jgi:hypothetical protein
MTGTNHRNTGENGVSESIGFLLIFTLIMVGIGLVTLYGYPMLLQQQTSADEQIMEKNMVVLQNDFKSLAYKTVPYKETSLKVGGGTLFAYNMSRAGPIFRIYGASGEYLPGGNKTGELRYESAQAQTQISLQNGAVVQQSTTGATAGSVMLARPRWFYDAQTQTLVVNVINVNSTDTLSRSGIGTVQMALGPTTYTPYPIPPGETVNIDITTDPGQDLTSWSNYIQNTLNIMTCTTTGSTVTCTSTAAAPVTTLVIKQTQIIIQSL